MDQVELVPTGAPNLATFRGTASSADYNTAQRAAYNDLALAYQQLQTLQKNTLFSNEILAGQNTAAQTKLVALEAQVNSLAITIQSLKTLASGVAGGAITLSKSLYNTQPVWGGFPSYYPVTQPLPTISRADYNAEFGQLTPAVLSTTSKTYIADALTGEAIFPPGVVNTGGQVIRPSVTPYTVDQNDPSNMVDGDSSTYWRRNVYFSANQHINYVGLTVSLTLPVQYLSSLLCNYVTILPYPEFGIDISSVIVHGLPGTPALQLLPLDVLGNIIPLTATNRVRLFFPEQNVSSVEVTFIQNRANTYLVPGLQCFSIGASTIDVGYVAFSLATPSNGTNSASTAGTAKALIPFTLNSNYFKTIKMVEPVLPGVSYAVYALSSPIVSANLSTIQDIQPIPYGASLPMFVDTVYVEVTLTPTNNVLPIVNAVQLDFVPVYLNT